MNSSGVHAYLDHIFQGRDNVSDEEVIAAKNDYWKQYNTALKKRQRLLHREFSVRFSLSEFESIKERLYGRPVSRFIRQAVLEYSNKNIVAPTEFNTSLIEQQLFLIQQLSKEICQVSDAPEYLLTDIDTAINSVKSELKLYDN